jgi:translation initiation factor IF-2
MADDKMMRLSQVARQLNVGTSTIADLLAARGFKVENSPNAKITSEQFDMLAKEFKSSALEKREASGLTIGKKHSDNLVIDTVPPVDKRDKTEDEDFFFNKNTVDKDISVKKQEPVKETSKDPVPVTQDRDALRHKLPGIKVVGKIELDKKSNIVPPVTEEADKSSVVDKSVIDKTSLPEITKPVQPTITEPPVIIEKNNPEPVQTPILQPKEQPVAETQSTPKEESKPVEVPTPKQEAVAVPVTTVEDKVPVAPIVPVAQDEPKVDNNPQKKQTPKVEEPSQVDIAPQETPNALVTAKAETLKGLTVLGKIELPMERDRNKKKGLVSAPAADDKKKSKRKRKRLRVGEGEGTDNKTQTNTSTTSTNGKPLGENNRPFQPGNRTNNTNSGVGRPINNSGVGRPNNTNNTGNPNAGKPTTGSRPNTSNNNNANRGKKPFGKPAERVEVSDKQIQDQIKATLAKLSGNKPGSGQGRAKYRGMKRAGIAAAKEEKLLQEQEDSKVLKVTEFISANDLASLMGVSVNEVISVCMNLGMFVSINQRLDAEAITVITDEFGYDAEFTSAEEEIEVALEDNDLDEDLSHRAPIVTIMGHVDHGKTSLLDYIRSSKVTAGEAGGITQHIGAYDVTTDTGKRIAFLDTPGHEAFTAMRARGAKITDVVIIVVAADDNVMPQTKEAINHAQVAGVPIVIAINKVDKPNANPDKIKEELAKENILVEEWGGKYQSQEISAKTGQGIAELLEKVLLEAELLELKANADKKASGTVIEASLDKGRGYVTTIMVQTGTLRIGDVLLAGAHYGRVKAMMDHRGKRLKHAGPSTPVQVLGLSGAPQAGDKFNVLETEREAREIANKREQIIREQSIRTKKHITLDEIGRRLAIGNFKELNVIVKGDVDGSVEALSDSLLRLSTEEVQVRIIHKGVGQISESDVLLASASDAIIIAFQVRPSANARKLAEQEEIEIRQYSIIYDAINELKDAMEGMLAPKVEEVIVGTVEIREIFRISKIGTVAGCYVTEGSVKRNNKIRVVRDGIVVHTGDIDALKRFKDDVNEVKYGYEFGLSIKNFNDMEVGDTIESFEQKETKRTL